MCQRLDRDGSRGDALLVLEKLASEIRNREGGVDGVSDVPRAREDVDRR